MAVDSWPTIVTEAGLVTTSPVQPGDVLILNDVSLGMLDTGTLGGDTEWSDLSNYIRSCSITHPANRQQGPLYTYPPSTMAANLRNEDGRFDPDNLAGPYVAAGETELTAMVPVRSRVLWAGTEYPLYYGYTDSWGDDGQDYGPTYAEAELTATDAQKILNGINLPTIGAVGAGEKTGARISRILDLAGWHTGTRYRTIATGDSTVQAYVGGDNAWNSMQLTTDSEIGELYMGYSGEAVFRNRQAILSEARSNTVQAVFGDSPGTSHSAGIELDYVSVSRAKDDTTIANDVQATREGGSLQQVQDLTSYAKYKFFRTYSRSDLILQDDTTSLNWARWVLYIAKDDENRMEQIIINPLKDPDNLWPQVLGRKRGDRIQVWRRPPGVAAFSRDCFIRGIQHQFNAERWRTTWTLQDATRYSSFLVLDNVTLGQLNSNALAY